MPDCPFCNIEYERIIKKSQYSLAFFDSYPVNRGHVLIVPKRHEADYFKLEAEEKADMANLIEYVKDYLQTKYSPDGFNIGINIGEAAGQSIFHCHIHIIPRYKGDVDNPLGGVRGVIPNKQKY